MLFNLQQRLLSLRMVASLAEFLKQPDSLESVFKVSASLKNSALGADVPAFARTACDGGACG